MEHQKYAWNQEIHEDFKVKTVINQTTCKKQNMRREPEIEVVELYMQYFDLVIEEKILQNNESLYTNMTKFLLASSTKLSQVCAMITENKDMIIQHSAFNVKKEQASQIPTCLVITSSESASSIETQFETVAK